MYVLPKLLTCFVKSFVEVFFTYYTINPFNCIIQSVIFSVLIVVQLSLQFFIYLFVYVLSGVCMHIHVWTYHGAWMEVRGQLFRSSLLPPCRLLGNKKLSGLVERSFTLLSHFTEPPNSYFFLTFSLLPKEGNIDPL